MALLVRLVDFPEENQMVAQKLNLLHQSISTTCERLEALHKELAAAGQGNPEPYTTGSHSISKQLYSLLQSATCQKDKQIKILTCCCLADIFKISAPEAPFSKAELLTIFTHFFKQLVYVKDASHPLFHFYFYLLESISTFKSVALVGDLNADQIVNEIFVDFFNIIRSDMTMTVQVFLRDVLFQLIEELPYLQQSVIETIVERFSEKYQKSNPAAFKLACDLCTLTEDKLQRYICQYFSDMMIASSKSDQEEFEVHHSLILQIFYNVPALLLNVVPQLDEELKVENVMIRSCATNTLGKMFAKSGVQWVDAYPAVFKSWCDRRNDKSAQIRSEWVHLAGDILRNQPEMINSLETFLKSKLHDPEDKVRVGALTAIGIVCSDHPDLLHESTLQEVAGRCRDKKPGPRIEAMRVLGGLFDRVYNLSLQTEDISLDQFMWIPGNILEVLYLDDAEMSIAVEKTVLVDLIPPLPDHNIRTVRLLKILCGLNEKQRNAFLCILTRQAAAIQTFTLFIEHCVIANGNGDDARKAESEKILKKIANFLVAKMPDRVKAYNHLMKIVELNNGRVYKLFRNIMNPAMDFKSILKYTKELDSILSKHSGLLETIGIFLRRISLVLMNKDTMDVLLRRVRNGKDQLDKAAEVLIKDISRIFPALYSSQIGTFKSIIIANESKELGYTRTNLVTEAVIALAKFVKAFPAESPQDDETVARLKDLALKGDLIQAKNASTILAKGGRDDECREIIEARIGELTTDFDKLLPILGCLKSMAFYCHHVYREYAEETVKFIVLKVLMCHDYQELEGDSDWRDFDQLESIGKAKVLGLKILVKSILASARDPIINELETKSVLKICRTLIESEGELLSAGGGKETPFFIKTHLRLTAGLAFIKMAAFPQIADLFNPGDFNDMALLIQDPVYYARSTYIEKLCQAISAKKIPSKYCMLLMLLAEDPELSLRANIKNFLIRRAKHQRNLGINNFNADASSKRVLLEHHFPEFCHILAHHPDFSVEELDSFERYCTFFLETIATSENISYLYHLANQMKTVRDRYLEDSTPLYIIAEMLIIRVRSYSVQHNWPLQTYPGKIAIPKTLFLRLPDDKVSDVLKTVYYKDGEKELTKSKGSRRSAKRLTSAASDAESDTGEIDYEKENSAKRTKSNEPSPVRKSTRIRKTRTSPGSESMDVSVDEEVEAF